MSLIAMISLRDPFFNNRTRPIMYTIQPDGCYNCISHAQTKEGYPRISRNGKPWKMSRLIYTWFKGEIPQGYVVRHTCDNPRCINPDHLELGTIQDNNHDRVLRNRSAYGERIGTSKLTENDVIFIKESSLPASELAGILRVSTKTIWRIRNNKSWVHVGSSRLRKVMSA